MPDGTGGMATAIYWVATGKLPVEDLENDDPRRADQRTVDERRQTSKLRTKESDW